MSPIVTSLIIFACVFGGAMIGLSLRSILPDHHLSSDSRDVIKLTIGLIGTMSALLLSLLVASAKGSFDTRRTELTQIATNTIMLDRVLAHYGPDAAETREMLRKALARMIDELWSNDGSLQNPVLSQLSNRELLFDKIRQLTPKNETQRALQTQAEAIAIGIGQTRWLLNEQAVSSISVPLLVVVVFWLTTLFLTFGTLTPRNMTVVIALFVGSLSVAGALFLILELDQPFNGLITISDVPLKNALVVLGK
ncbi:MAG TPA: hypothetical protein VMT61_06490 [Candidatus Binataceae bacterium]|nr:hypothetical protein [Candidatus Binataceae bacterium]